MITKPTVFILGAGVSMPYGFPSGSTLLEQICESTTRPPNEHDPTALIDKAQIRERLVTRFGEEQTERFCNALQDSQKLSIDSFLEHRPEFMEIGKLAAEPRGSGQISGGTEKTRANR